MAQARIVGDYTGRRAPRSELLYPRIHARDVLKGAYTGNVPTIINWYANTVFPTDLNDQIGDCTIADVAHAVGSFSRFGQGTEVIVSNADVLTMYSRVSGYIPGNANTDTGCVIQDVLNDWRKNGIGTPAHKILAFFQVNYKDLNEVKACTWLFLGVTLGVNLPQSALDQFQGGQTWDLNPSLNNTVVGGHDVRLIGFNADGTVDLVTWGTVVKATWAWVQQWTEEAWSEADAEIVKNNAAPNGLSVTALNAAYTQVTGQPGPFAAPPTPTPPAPTPVPPTPVPPTPVPIPPPTPVVSAADAALAAAIPAHWLSHPGWYFRESRVVSTAIQAWLAATGQVPGQ